MTLKSEFKDLFTKQQTLIDFAHKTAQLAEAISKDRDSKVLADLANQMQQLLKKIKPANIHTWKDNHGHLEEFEVVQSKFDIKYKGTFIN